MGDAQVSTQIELHRAPSDSLLLLGLHGDPRIAQFVIRTRLRLLKLGVDRIKDEWLRGYVQNDISELEEAIDALVSARSEAVSA